MIIVALCQPSYALAAGLCSVLARVLPLVTVCPPAVPSLLVREIQAARRRRAELFSDQLFSDPAWDILLELYALHLEQLRTSVSSVCVAASVPASTTLRWIAKLEADDLVVRTEDPLDARRNWIALTSDGAERMNSYIERLPLCLTSIERTSTAKG